MYYILNYAPSILYIVVTMMSIKIDFGVFAIVYLFAQPLYLLIVNIPFIYKKSISYVDSMAYMVSVILFNVLDTIIIPILKTGKIAGDVPMVIFLLMLCIPISIIFLGIKLLFFLKDR